MKTLKTFNEEQVSEKEMLQLRNRKAVRVVIFDDENNVAIIFARNNNYYELPGGGVEEGESLEQAAIREAKEEAGCDIEIMKELGCTVEVRKRLEMVNHSFAYLAKIKGNKGETSLAEDEISEGMEVVWVPMEEAVNLVASSDTLKDLYDKYVMERDLTFLEEAKSLLARNDY